MVITLCIELNGNAVVIECYITTINPASPIDLWLGGLSFWCANDNPETVMKNASMKNGIIKSPETVLNTLTLANLILR